MIPGIRPEVRNACKFADLLAHKHDIVRFGHPVSASVGPRV